MLCNNVMSFNVPPKIGAKLVHCKKDALNYAAIRSKKLWALLFYGCLDNAEAQKILSRLQHMSWTLLQYFREYYSRSSLFFMSHVHECIFTLSGILPLNLKHVNVSQIVCSPLIIMMYHK